MLSGDIYRKQCKRYNIPGHAHELTFSCYKNRAFLSKDRTCQYLIDAIIKSKNKYQFDLWSYVFMPDHVHLLICPHKSNYCISDILLSIKQPVSRKAIGYLKKDNPQGLKLLATGQQHRPYRFWQKGGGYDRNITSVDTIIHAIRYMHNNPVRKQLVDAPEKWYYSSAKDWLDIGKGPIPVDFMRYQVN